MYRQLITALLSAILLCLQAVPIFASGTVNASWVWPIKGPVITEFKFDFNNYYAKDQHTGIDIKADAGREVVAPLDGKVAWKANNPFGRGGVGISIDHKDDTTTTYFGLAESKVKKGDVVEQEQVIGLVGSEGDVFSSDIPHLHFGMFRTSSRKELKTQHFNPLEFLPAVKQEMNETTDLVGMEEPAAAINQNSASDSNPEIAPPAIEVSPADNESIEESTSSTRVKSDAEISNQPKNYDSFKKSDIILPNSDSSSDDSSIQNQPNNRDLNKLNNHQSVFATINTHPPKKKVHLILHNETKEDEIKNSNALIRLVQKKENAKLKILQQAPVGQNNNLKSESDNNGPYDFLVNNGKQLFLVIASFILLTASKPKNFRNLRLYPRYV